MPELISPERTVVLSSTLLVYAEAQRRARRRARLRLLAIAVVALLLGDGAPPASLPAAAHGPPAPVVTVARAPSAPPRPAVLALAPSAPPRPAVLARAPSAPKPAVASAAEPVRSSQARLETRVYAEPTTREGACPALPPDAAASDEEHALLQLAIEAYQAGRRSEAHLLFESLSCRPEVGPPARFMARLLAPATALLLPRDRKLRVRRLLDETSRELAEQPELWALKEALTGAELVNPKLEPYDFQGQPKCNIFIGEMLFRAGFVPPATPASGQHAVAYPTVDQMVARARTLAAGGAWEHAWGEQWFDVVPKDGAQPGDLVLIASKDRGDHLPTEHGHVEIISRVSSRDGELVELGTVGARTRGIRFSPTAGRVFGAVVEGSYVLAEQAIIVRPRLR